MKRSLTNLPSLHQANLSQTTRPKIVKQIQQKLLHHDEQIIKNQKIILALTNDFKSMMEELKSQKNINKEKQVLYQNSLLQLSKLLKKNKQSKSKIQHLQALLTQKNKQLEGERALRQREKSASNTQLDNQIQQLLKSDNKKTKEIQQLKKIVSNLQSENLQLKEKLSSVKIQAKSSQQLKKIKQQLDTVINQNKQKTAKILQLQKENSKNSEELRKHAAFLKQHSNCQARNANFQARFHEVKKTNEILLQKNKHLQNKIIDLQANLKRSKDQNAKIQQQMSQINQKRDSQITENSSKYQKERKNNEALTKLHEGLKQQIQRMRVFEKKYLKIGDQTGEIKKKTANLKQSLICDFCKKILSKPVTNIPCGHSYCMDCKKGYEKECKRCVTGSNPIKREAVYRNQLLDQMVDAHNHLMALLQIFQK